jgi:hypothetical protein
MSEENTENILIQHKLEELRNEIMEFAKASNDCSIIMSNHHSEEIGEIKGSLNYGTYIMDKTQRQIYDGLVGTHDKFKRKLLRCSCK